MCYKVDSAPNTLFVPIQFLVKMGSSQKYFFALLLASLSGFCNSDCPTTEPYYEPSYHICAKLYSMLEAALLANPDNLYQLQDCFFPSSSSEPIYVPVTFSLNENSYRNSTCWTSSALLRSVNLYTLYSFQNILQLTVGLSGKALSFHLKVNFTVSDYPDYIINAVLRDLTSWVSTLDC